MSKKYRQKLRHLRRAGQVRALVVIDDNRIRAEVFSGAAKILRKMDRLEAAIDTFHNKDQRLFSDWFNLTFQKDREKIENKNREYKDLATLHNEIVAAASLMGLSMPEAYRLIRTEQEQFAQGDEAERERIRKLRLERERFAQDEMEKEYRANCRDEDMDFSEDEEEFGFGRDRAEESASLSSESTLTEKDREELEAIQRLPDNRLRRLTEDFGDAMGLLVKSFELSQKARNPRVFLRVWDSCSRKIQAEVIQVFSASGMPLKSIIEDMRQWVRMSEGDTDELFEEDEEFIDFGSAARSRPSRVISPREEEALKTLYRKLARTLHPDLQTEQRPKDQIWKAKLWLRVQAAYKAKAVSELERLFHMALLRGKDLRSLTLNEIQSSCEWLAEDVRSLEREARQLRKSPAWGFMKRKNFDPLVKTIRKEFRDQLATIQDEIEQLQAFHSLLERMRPRTRGKTGKRRSRTARTRRPNTQKRNREKNSQMSLF
ncbi:MAG: hypothetical protein AB7G93_14945 [Bdellovibrionales bacterium]